MKRRYTKIAIACLVPLLATVSPDADAATCASNADCSAAEICHATGACPAGTCVPAFSMARFPIDVAPAATPYTAPMLAVMDHSGLFYSRCCDTRITAFSGASVERGEDNTILCPVPTGAPGCLSAACQCGYANEDGSPFDVTAGYSSPFGATALYYDGHAGYDYGFGFGTPIVASAAGSLCKAAVDLVNGSLGMPTAWDAFHTFYVDHGVRAGHGWSTWYLHAEDLQGSGTGGEQLADLEPGECAPVVEGQLVATVGNFGTGMPHLHFEVRRYVPADGPQALSAKVVDAYGWRGTYQDPLADAGENYQAASQLEPLWLACGNGRVECGEQCDDGNSLGGDCCSSSCQFEPAAAPCTSGRACAVERCDGAGACIDVTQPKASCLSSLDPQRSSLRLRATETPASARIRFKWSAGEATSASDFADPTVSDAYRICIFDESGPPLLVFGAEAPAGGTCSGGPCWKARGNPPGARGYRYKDRERSPDGLQTVVLEPGADGAARITLSGRGEHLDLGPAVSETPVRVQIESDNGRCWEALF